MKRIGVLLVLPLVLAEPAWPAECSDVAACCDQDQGCCAQCGAKKICKVVCEMEEVKKTRWVVECEEFCAPLPTIPACRCAGCGDGDCSGGCRSECGKNDWSSLFSSLFSKPPVPPKCGKLRSRKTLQKKEITSKVPVYRCVVVPTCCCDASRPCQVPNAEDAANPARGRNAMLPAETKK